MQSNSMRDEIFVVEDKTGTERLWPKCHGCGSKVQIWHDADGIDWKCPSCEIEGKGLPGEPGLSDTHRVCDLCNLCDGGVMIVPVALIAKVEYYNPDSEFGGLEVWVCPGCVEWNEWRRSMSFKAMLDKANSGADGACESCGWATHVAEFRGRRLCKGCIDEGVVDLAVDFEEALNNAKDEVWWDGECSACHLRVKVALIDERWLCRGCVNNGEGDCDER